MKADATIVVVNAIPDLYEALKIASARGTDTDQTQSQLLGSS